MVQVSTRCASAGSRWNTPLATGIGSGQSAGQVTVPEMDAAWRRVRDHRVQVVRMDGQLEAHRLLAHAAPGAGDFVVVGDAACAVGARDHRLGADPALHGLGELEARAEQRRILLDELLDRVLRQLDGAGFEMAGCALEERFGVVRDRRDLLLQPLQQTRSRPRRAAPVHGGPAGSRAAPARSRSSSPARRTGSGRRARPAR